MVTANPLTAAYDALSATSHTRIRSDTTSALILNLVKVSLAFLNNSCQCFGLVSRVEGKSYCSYAKSSAPTLLSRPANIALFVPDRDWVETNWHLLGRQALPREAVSKLCYTMATAYSLASDLFDRNNKKGPATYFEYLVGHLAARKFSVNPVTQASFTIGSRQVMMTMDYIFDRGEGLSKVHLPVKLSTRERVVQAWAHQRMLDAAYGEGVYQAFLIVHSETKLDSRNHEVVEIVVPDQWLAYQSLLAKMDCIYYFDLPSRYATLSAAYPDLISVKEFADFFTE